MPKADHIKITKKCIIDKRINESLKGHFHTMWDKKLMFDIRVDY